MRPKLSRRLTLPNPPRTIIPACPFEQGQAAVLFLHRRADDEEKQHIVQEMVPAAVAQHMAEEPDVKQRVFQRGTVDAEQMGGRPAAGVLAEEQHPQ